MKSASSTKPGAPWSFESGLLPLIPGFFWISGLKQGVIWGVLCALGLWFSYILILAVRPVFPKKVLVFSAVLFLSAVAQAAWNRLQIPPYWMLTVLLAAAPGGDCEKSGSFFMKKRASLPTDFWAKGLGLLGSAMALGLCRQILSRSFKLGIFSHASGLFILMAVFCLAAPFFFKPPRIESRV